MITIVIIETSCSVQICYLCYFSLPSSIEHPIQSCGRDDDPVVLSDVEQDIAAEHQVYQHGDSVRAGYEHSDQSESTVTSEDGAATVVTSEDVAATVVTSGSGWLHDTQESTAATSNTGGS